VKLSQLLPALKEAFRVGPRYRADRSALRYKPKRWSKTRPVLQGTMTTSLRGRDPSRLASRVTLPVLLSPVTVLMVPTKGPFSTLEG